MQKKLGKSINYPVEPHYNASSGSFWDLVTDIVSGSHEERKTQNACSLKDKVTSYLMHSTLGQIVIVAHSQGGDITLKAIEKIDDKLRDCVERIHVVLLGAVRGPGSKANVTDFQHVDDMAANFASCFYYDQCDRASVKIHGECKDLFCHSNDTYLEDTVVINKIKELVSVIQSPTCPNLGYLSHNTEKTGSNVSYLGQNPVCFRPN